MKKNNQANESEHIYIMMHSGCPAYEIKTKIRLKSKMRLKFGWYLSVTCVHLQCERCCSPKLPCMCEFNWNVSSVCVQSLQKRHMFGLSRIFSMNLQQIWNFLIPLLTCITDWWWQVIRMCRWEVRQKKEKRKFELNIGPYMKVPLMGY